MASSPAGQSCRSCRYFRERQVTIAGVRYSGQCCRYPPNIPDEDNDAQFPAMPPGGWCGEYATAEPQTVSDGAATMARLVLLGDLAAAHALADRLKGRED